jgi:UDP-N-acetylmuramoylalanine--D-glutamate ligase
MQKPKLPTLKDVPALVVILGVHGGGVANTKWLLKKGAKVSVTDMRGEQQLANSLRQFTQAEKKKIKFILGGQHEEDFLANELILAGPGVPRDSKFLAVAKKANKQIENDASLFFRFLTVPSIGVTGTRGKSTTTEWVAQLLRKKYPGVRASGNTPANPFFKRT